MIPTPEEIADAYLFVARRHGVSAVRMYVPIARGAMRFEEVRRWFNGLLRQL